MKLNKKIIVASFFWAANVLASSVDTVSLWGENVPITATEFKSKHLIYLIDKPEPIPENINKLKNLVSLSICYCNVNTIEVLKPLVTLEALYLSRNWIQFIEPLTSLINLKELNLARNQIESIKPLTSLINLEELDLHENNIQFVEPLMSLINLRRLDLHENHIQFVEPLTSLINLKELNLAVNQIKSIKPLMSLINLEELHLHENNIQFVEPLMSLINLRRLDLSKNQIHSIEPLILLTNLENLFLNQIKVQSLEPLTSLINLKSLSLSENQIQSLESLKSLINLTELHVDGNQIEFIEPLMSLINLEALFIRNNTIETVPYDLLKNFPLKYIYFSGNNIKILSVTFLEWAVDRNIQVNFSCNPIDITHMGIDPVDAMAKDASALNTNEDNRSHYRISLDARCFPHNKSNLRHCIRMLFYLKNITLSFINVQGTPFEVLEESDVDIHTTNISKNRSFYIDNDGYVKTNFTPTEAQREIFNFIEQMGSDSIFDLVASKRPLEISS